MLRALQSLDPSNESRRYFRLPQIETDEKSESQQWIDTADSIDRAARTLVQHCLARAAESTSADSKEYLALAEAASLKADIDLVIIRLLTDESDLLKAQHLTERARKLIEDKLSRLKGFTDFAVAVASDLRQQLDSTPSSEDISPE